MYFKRLLLRQKFSFSVCILLFSVSLILIVLCLSSLQNKTEGYIHFKELFSRKGRYINYLSEIDDKEFYDLLRSSDDFETLYAYKMAYMTSEEHYEAGLLDENIDNRNNLYCCGYTYDLASLYTPKLNSGKWITERDENDNMLQGVFAYSDDLKIGDVVTFTDGGDGKVDIKVIGILSPDSRMLGINKNKYNIKRFTDFYTNVQYEVYVLAEDLEKRNIYTELSGPMIITYKDDINIDEKRSLDSALTFFGSDGESLENIKYNSIKYLTSEIMIIAPIAISMLVIAFLSVTVLSVIGTKANLSTYNIFCICGAKRIQCTYYSLMMSGGIIAISALLSVTALYIIDHSGKYIVTINAIEIIVCVVICIVYMLSSFAFSIGILRKRKDKDWL